jgi:hypothetical protein
LRSTDFACFSLDKALSFHLTGEMPGREVASRRRYPRVQSAAS